MFNLFAKRWGGYHRNSYKIYSLLLKMPTTLLEDEVVKIKLFYNNYEVAKVYEIVNSLGITPFASEVFMYMRLDYDYWDRIHQQFVERNTRYKQILEKIFVSARNNNINSIAVYENYAVNLLINDCIGCFTSSDIDLTADSEEKEKIYKIMNYHGFFEKIRGKRKKYISLQASTFYSDSIPGGLWINIMWEPVVRSFFNQELISKRLSIFRYQAKNMANSEIKSLIPTELLYYCCLHIAAGHYYTLSPGLRLYVDIDRLVRCSNDINWRHIANWMVQDGMSTRVAIVLYISSITMGTPVESSMYNSVINKYKNKLLVKFLLDVASRKIIQRGSSLSRLIIELLSNDHRLK